MRIFIAVPVILLLVVPLAVVAQDVPTDPDEPDNECFDNGLMHRADGNGCESDWAWTCGWYLDNWLDEGGWANVDNFFPDWCAPEILLPSKPEVNEPEAEGGESGISIIPYPTAGCLRVQIGLYGDFNGTNYLPTSSVPYLYLNDTCSGSASAVYSFNIVYAPDGAAVADYLCAVRFGESQVLGPRGDNVYVCG